MPNACKVLCAYSFPGRDSDYLCRGGGGGEGYDDFKGVMIFQQVFLFFFWGGGGGPLENFPKSRTSYDGGWVRGHKKSVC